MDVATKLRLAFEVFDYRETGTVTRDEMESVIGGKGNDVISIANITISTVLISCHATKTKTQQSTKWHHFSVMRSFTKCN